MNWSTPAIMGLALALFTCMPVHAQGSNAEERLDRAFERTIESNVPGWKLDPTLKTSTASSASRQKRWRNGESELTVVYTVEKSAQQAEQLLQRKITVLQVSGQPVDGPGQSAYLVAEYGAAGETALLFRHGTVLVEVFAPSLRVARTVGPLLADAITKAEIQR